ncbi:hypothetical protein TNCV_725541 [Trichonephila clavipes]|nr:hypothetical protein TNCV_725541 [Trichonephila clavipes]
MSSDPNDFAVLTPGHFLIGRSLQSLPEPDMADKLDNRLSQWQKLTKFVQFIWRKWRLDYINNLQARHKWQFEKENVIPNSMVILKDENLPPCKWTMERILEIVKGSDGKVRVVKVKTPQEIRVSTVHKELYCSPTGGHFGVKKVCERFYWNNVRSDVEKCCSTCDPCAARKGPRKRTRGRLQLHNVEAPFELIAFDILDPLPRSSDGNNNILVVMDYFTNWPEAYPISDQEASTVSEVLVQHWISRFGIPLQLHSDQGRNFDSAVCKRLCEILTIDKTRTTALHPQPDSMVERFNRTFLNSLSLLASNNQQDWDNKLPLFLLAYRSAVHETSGYSSSQMLFGRDLRLPVDLLFSQPPDAPLASEEYIEKLSLQARMEEIHHLTRERRGMASDTTQKQPDTISTKATKCGYGIRNIANDSLRSCRPTGKVLTQSEKD